MTDDEQKQIFARNLNKYIHLNQKQQIDVAKDLSINPTTLNMWCNGNSIPKVSTIQKLADYFRIGKSDLTDDKKVSDSELEYSDTIMKIALKDKRFSNIIIAYNNLPTSEKDLICDFFEKFIL